MRNTLAASLARILVAGKDQVNGTHGGTQGGHRGLKRIVGITSRFRSTTSGQNVLTLGFANHQEPRPSSSL